MSPEDGGQVPLKGRAGRSVRVKQGWGQIGKVVENNFPPWPLVGPDSISKV